MARTKTPAPEVTETGATTWGGTHGATPWTGRLVQIADYTFVVLDRFNQVRELCGNCQGGHREEYAGLHNGVCYYCNGVGAGKVIAGGLDEAREVIRKRLMARAARERKAQRDADAKKVAGMAWAEANAEVAAQLAGIAQWVVDGGEDGERGAQLSTPLYSFAFTVRRGEALSEKQTEFARTLMAGHAKKRARVEAEEAAKAKLVHLGKVNEKLEVSGTVTRNLTVGLDSPYGPRRMVIVTTAEGNVAKTFTTAEWAYEVEEGEQVTLRGTVKELDEYQGVPQTVLVRARKA